MAQTAYMDTTVNPQVPGDIHDRVVELVLRKTGQRAVAHVPCLSSPEAEQAIFEQVTADATVAAASVRSVTAGVCCRARLQLPLDDIDTFVLVDASFSVRKFQRWSELIPRVKPHLAIKCNPNPILAASLAMIDGCGFDCASIGEIKQVLSCGVSPRRIIFANPCKAPEAVAYALINGVATMTFDSESELQKIRKIVDQQKEKDVPVVEPKMVIRLKVPDSHSLNALGTKFGALITRVSALLETADRLDLEVIGISFHCGSGCYDAVAYVEALEVAREAFDIAEKHGKPFWFLDIGGGYPGFDGTESECGPDVPADKRPLSLVGIAEQLNPALDRLFPAESGVRVISEPGRYFVEGGFHMYARIFAKREIYSQELVNKLLRSKKEASAPAAAPEAPINLDDDDAESGQPVAVLWYVAEGAMGCFKDVILSHFDFPVTLASHLTECSPSRTDSIDVAAAEDMDEHAAHGSAGYPEGVQHILVGIEGTAHVVLAQKLEFEVCVGTWVRFERFGAYTMSIASDYASLATRSYLYVWAEHES